MKIRIKELCKEKSVTLSSIAEQIGTTQTSLSRALGENGNPTLETLEKIASALEVPITELFERPCDEVVGSVRIGGDTHVLNSKDDIKKLAENL